MKKIDFATIKGLCSVSKEERDRSFDLIFEKYRHLVYYVSYDILKDEEEAKDNVNDAFLKMYEKRRYFAGEKELKYYLLVTAKNLSINRLKAKEEHQDYSDEEVGKGDAQSANLYLDKFKDILDEEEYRYLVLHLLYGFSFREIGKANGLTTSQVSSKYRRGIKKLRSFYGGQI